MDQTRRAYLAATGAIAVGTSISGCLGSPPAAGTDHSCELTERNPVSELPQPRLGPEDATVTVTAYEDFACPHCATFATGAFADLTDEFGDDPEVAFERYDFPVVNSDWSERVANAARSIQEAHDDETFFAFAELAYENQADYTWQVVGDLASEVGADPCRSLSDATYKPYESVIQANAETGQANGVTGTPTVLVNGQQTNATYTAIENAIEANR